MFTVPQNLKDVSESQLVDNHRMRKLPLAGMAILGRGRHYDVLDVDGSLTMSYREVFRRTIALGMVDSSLALIDSMHFVAAAMIADPSVPQEQRTYLAGVMKSKIMAAFISGRHTRSEAGLPSFFTDVWAELVEYKGEPHWRVSGIKGVATNAEGCDYALVTFKSKDDKTPQGSLFGFIRMRDDSGGLAPGIKIDAESGDTLGAASTRSCSVEFKNVMVPVKLVLPWYENAIEHFLIVNGKAAYGAYTGAYNGACKRVLTFLTHSKAKYASEVKHCAAMVNEAERALLTAADAIDRGKAPNETMPLLLDAKVKMGKASKELVGVMAELSGFHDFSWNGPNRNTLVFLLTLNMANGHPPSTAMAKELLASKG